MAYKNKDNAQIQRALVIAAYKQFNCGVTATAKFLRKRKSYVAKWVAHHKKYKNLSDAPRSGRPKALTPKAVAEAKRQLLRSNKPVRFVTNTLKANGQIAPEVHHTTVYRHLQDGYRPVKAHIRKYTPVLNPRTKALRVIFAKHHLKHKTNWARVLFVDSKYFYVCRRNRTKVWAYADEPPVAQAPKHSDAIHVYGGFCVNGTTPLVEVSGTTGYQWKGKPRKGVRAPEYQDVLRKVLLPAGKRLMKKGWQLLHDRAPPHIAKTTQAMLAKKKVQVIEHWPANSPDLNPIENIWAAVVRELNRRGFTSLSDMRRAVRAAWASLAPAVLKSLAASMPARLAKVIELDGGYTGY
jgi:transposase